MFHQKKNGEFFIGAVVGSTLGAMTALLFTTREGKKIKENLIKKFHKAEKNPHFVKMKNKIKRELKNQLKKTGIGQKAKKVKKTVRKAVKKKVKRSATHRKSAKR